MYKKILLCVAINMFAGRSGNREMQVKNASHFQRNKYRYLGAIVVSGAVSIGIWMNWNANAGAKETVRSKDKSKVSDPVIAQELRHLEWLAYISRRATGVDNADDQEPNEMTADMRSLTSSQIRRETSDTGHITIGRSIQPISAEMQKQMDIEQLQKDYEAVLTCYINKMPEIIVDCYRKNGYQVGPDAVTINNQYIACFLKHVDWSILLDLPESDFENDAMQFGRNAIKIELIRFLNMNLAHATGGLVSRSNQANKDKYCDVYYKIPNGNGHKIGLRPTKIILLDIMRVERNVAEPVSPLSQAEMSAERFAHIWYSIIMKLLIDYNRDYTNIDWLSENRSYHDELRNYREIYPELYACAIENKTSSIERDPVLIKIPS